MMASTRASIGIALTWLGLSWGSGQLQAQEPVPSGLSALQGKSLPIWAAPQAGDGSAKGQGGTSTPGSSGSPTSSGTDSSSTGSGAGANAGDSSANPFSSANSGTGAGGAFSQLGGSAGASGAAPGIIGDFSPPISIRAVAGLPQPPPIPIGSPKPPSLPNPRYRSLLSPSVRGFKIAENQSPFPQDRLFFTFNYFNDVNAKLDKYFASPIDHINIYRYVFGYEKTFNDGKGSIGLRLPLNSIHADTSPGLINQGGQATSLGNLTVYLKYILEYNPTTGNLISAGMAFTPPTGPGHFAGASFLGGSNNTTVQPFLGYFFNLTESKKLFFQGFTALDVPVDFSDVTLFYNDMGLGYYLKRDPDAVVSAIVPTLEVHVNAPLNHRNEYSLRDFSGTPTSVNITSGLNVEIRRNSLFTIGVVAPTTGPRPFNVEAVALFNYRFGNGSRPRPTPVIGG
jgi:hypothetical protein